MEGDGGLDVDERLDDVVLVIDAGSARESRYCVLLFRDLLKCDVVKTLLYLTEL